MDSSNTGLSGAATRRSRQLPWLRWLSAMVPFLAALAAFLVGALMLFAMGANPVKAYAALLQGAFGSANSIADTIVKATPLLFVGAGICIAFRAGVINIGGEGQMIVGGLAATALALALPDWPSWALITVCVIGGTVAGGLWAALPGALKAYGNVNEILTTIMMNEIAVRLMSFLLSGPLMDPAQIETKSFIPQTARVPFSADLPRFAPTTMHAGVILAVIMAVLVWVLLWRTSIGFRIRAVGLSPHASRRAGIRVERYILLSLVLSGALAGMAGASQVLGVNHRMFSDGTAASFTTGAGFNGIVAALFGQLNPLGTIPASMLFGALLVGANTMQRAVQVPTALITALDGLVVVFVVSSELFRRRLIHRQEVQDTAEAAADKTAPVQHEQQVEFPAG